MEFDDLIRALVGGDTLAARQWVADATREGFDWSRVPRPNDLSPSDMAVAAGVIELLALRTAKSAPDWTKDVRPAPEPVFLVQAARRLPRLRRLCEEEGPEPLRRRRVLAPPEFLTAA